MCAPPLPSVDLATTRTPAWHPPTFLTHLLLNSCHLLITELLNVSPSPLLFSPLVYQCFLLLRCQQVYPPSSCSPIISPRCSSSVSLPLAWANDYSNKSHLRLHITSVIQTPVSLQRAVWACGLLSCAFVPRPYSSYAWCELHDTRLKFLLVLQWPGQESWGFNCSNCA